MSEPHIPLLAIDEAAKAAGRLEADYDDDRLSTLVAAGGVDGA